MTLSLGIDVGTSGVRSAVIGPTGDVLAMARQPHGTQSGDSINAELWWEAVQACLHAQMATLTEAGFNPMDVSAIAVDGTSGSMVLTDAALRPVSPALMYNSKGFDPEADQIAKFAAENHIAQGSNSALARAMRLLKLAEQAPAHLLHQADFVAAKLMGEGGRSDQNNALKTGFDPGDETWPDWIDQVLDPKLLPKISPVGADFGEISNEVAQELGLSARTKIRAGTTDSIAAFFACAPFQPGVAVTSLGSTLAVKILSESRIDDPKIGLYSHRVGDVWLAGGASNTGGAVIAAHFSPEEIDNLSRDMDPADPTGLKYYPLLEPGERFPTNDPDLQPRMEPRPADDATFLQAIFEGIAQIEWDSYQAIKLRGGGFPSTLFSAGRGASNVAFQAIREQRLNTKISTARDTEAAIGVARLALGLNSH